MRRLPLPVETVTVPDAFSPSQLALARDCRLRAVFAALGSSVPRLPTHPAAERGTIFHHLLERAARGLISQSTELRAAIRRELDDLLREAEVRLSSDPATAHFARLEETVPPVEWHNAVQEVIEVAERLAAAPPREVRAASSGRNPSDATHFDRLRGPGRWSEVRIDVPSLRLGGRMDVVERRGVNLVTVRDYKTGQIRERDGSVRPHIELQLRLYALAILAVEPSAWVELYASDGTADHSVLLDGAIIRETTEWLEGMLSELPAGALVRTEEVATPGHGCSFCLSRHVCPAYREVAPTIWRAGSDSSSLPLDTWGEATRVTQERGFLILELLDAAGRRVKVHRLDCRHAESGELQLGWHFWLFGLSAAAKRVSQGRFFHPRNFFELPSDSSERRAWSLAVFETERAASPL
jgi:RecB family exonuclease